MIIRRITIQDFGAVSFYEAVLSPEINIIDSRNVPEISAAIGFLLCSNVQQTIPPGWICPTTRLAAEVLIEACEYTVMAMPGNGRFTLTVTDYNGTDVTDNYQYILLHCPEQDDVDTFDGQDKTLPLRLFWYRNCEDSPVNVTGKTDSRTKLKTFRAHLSEYIKAFCPEPIHCQKGYLAVITPEGRFEVCCPGVAGEVALSETEEKLFFYTCFLNVAEFWADTEKIRNLHHEVKPLLIRNFLEFMDESTDISALIARTNKLQRQIIILTLPLGGD